MSYGNDTPLSSSDDDDADNQVIHEMKHTPGGFTETHLDGDATPQSDDSEDDNNDIDMDQDAKLWIRVLYEDRTETMELSRYDTLRELRAKINERDDMDMSECHYFSLSHTNDNSHYDDEEEEELIKSGRLLVDESIDASRYNKQTLSIYWKSFTITIVDGMDLSIAVRVSQDWDIKRLKDEVERIHNVRLQCLSYHGMELVDDQQLQYHEITKSGFTLISRISITVEDHTCDISTDLLICDFWDFDAVLRTYLDTERREAHKNAHFYYLGNKISLTEQVYALQLTNRSKLEYKVDSYPIHVYDSQSAANQNDLSAFTLEVYDYWTLLDVKKAYSKLTKKPFMEKEKFLSQERELEDNVFLWKLRLRDNEKLIIEREQQEVMCGYICCECGALVNLRRYDSVQCRQCFHGAVFKQRTSRVCQYSCR